MSDNDLNEFMSKGSYVMTCPDENYTMRHFLYLNSESLTLTSTESKNAVLEIPISSIIITKPQDSCSFLVMSKDSEYSFKVSSLSERDMWVAGLNKITKNLASQIVQILESNNFKVDRIQAIPGMLKNIVNSQSEDYLLRAKIQETKRSLVALRNRLGSIPKAKIDALMNCNPKENENLFHYILTKGFLCYALMLTPSLDQLTTQGYIKNSVFLTKDHSHLVLRPMSLFSSIELPIAVSDIISVVKGTELHVDKPFPHNTYLTLQTNNLVVVLSVEHIYKTYMDALFNLYLETNKLPLLQVKKSEDDILSICSSQLNSMMIAKKKMFKKYKNSLIESTCISHSLLQEIRELDFMNEEAIEGFFSRDVNYYLSQEKERLEERVDHLNKIIKN